MTDNSELNIKWMEPIYRWFEQIGATGAQEWVASLDATGADVRLRIREATEAITRYAADPAITGDGDNSNNLVQMTQLIRTVQARYKERPEDVDWLSYTVDALVQTADEHNRPETPALPNGEHVVLLHGLGRSHLSMVRLEQNLVNRGYGVSNLDYPSQRYSAETLVDQYIAPQIAESHGPNATKLHFVTHSLGGILTRYLARHHEIANMGRVVMLSPPNRGSEIVDLFRDNPIYKTINGPVGQQLGTRPDDLPNKLGPVDFELGIIMGNRSVDPLFSIVIPGTNDGKVSVERSQIEGMRDFLLVPHSHTFVMHSHTVIQQVLCFLRDGSFDHNAVQS